VAGVERPDLQDGYRDAVALARAFLDADDERRREALAAILSIYRRAAGELGYFD
jgi:hypothetical protein